MMPGSSPYVKSESEIVRGVWQVGGVTIATNMAGLGTNMKLGEGDSAVGGSGLTCKLRPVTSPDVGVVGLL